jgi:hypothetical protein
MSVCDQAVGKRANAAPGIGVVPGRTSRDGEDFGNHGGCSMEARISARPPESEPAMMSTPVHRHLTV